MMLGEFITVWTIRLALMCLAGALAARLLSAPQQDRQIARALWTAGCGLFVAHVVAAFHFYHHWSPSHAWEDTARQTYQLLGWAFGAGIYFSYLFLLLWVVDVVWWWLRPVSYARRSPWLDRVILSYLLFIAFNGAAVFKGGVTRWTAVAAFAILGSLIARRAWRTDFPSLRRNDSEPAPHLPAAEAPCRNKS